MNARKSIWDGLPAHCEKNEAQSARAAEPQHTNIQVWSWRINKGWFHVGVIGTHGNVIMFANFTADEIGQLMGGN
jgi:hypothetical protein